MRDNPKSTALLIAAFLFVTASCDFNATITNNSSHGDNDYFEEPLSAYSNKYEAALAVSNKAVEAFADKRFSDIPPMLAEDLRSRITDQWLDEKYGLFLSRYGEVVEFLPGQWGFTTHKENGEKVVYSTKIVIHEKASAFYHFRFVDDGRFQYISKFDINVRGENETVMAGVQKVIQSN